VSFACAVTIEAAAKQSAQIFHVFLMTLFRRIGVM